MNNKSKNTDNQRKDALIYCRVSTTKQEETGTSLDSQAAECIKYAEANGYRVAEVVKEAFSGAYLSERPKLNEQREKIKAGVYDAVIVYDVDRLSRNTAHLAIILDELEGYGVKMLFVSGDFDNSPVGKIVLQIKGFAAEMEREKIKERTVRGKKTKVQSGRLVPASNLYGYDFDKENARRIINPTESLIVRRIYEMFLSGTGIRGIYKTLNDENIPSPATGKRNLTSPKYTNVTRLGRSLWNKGAIYRILDEPAYSGHTIAWRYKGVRDSENGKRYYRIKTRDESEWIQMPTGTTPAIVTPDQFQAVRAKLDSNKGEATRNEMRPELLRGLVFCGDCSRKMYPETEVKRAKAYERKIYRCPSRSTIKCGGKAINADKCESAVWEKICDIIKNPHIVTAEIQRQQADSENNRKKIEKEVETRKTLLTRIESEITNLVSRAATVDESVWEVFQGQIKLKSVEKQRMSDAIGDIENRLASFDADTQAAKSLTEFSNRVSQKLSDFGFDEKRLTLEALNVKIEGNGKEFRLDISYPSILEKQVNETNHSTHRSAGFG